MKIRRNRGLNRRQFLTGTAAVGAGFWVAGTQAWADVERPNRRRISANEKLNVAFIAVAGRATGNIQGVSPLPNVNIVGLCDVDDDRLDPVTKQFPKAKTYFDYRRMIDEMKEIDAVVISTPDHHHAFATLAALRAGKHVYCEKPLTHSLQECRLVRETADQLKAVTQMGTQIHAMDNYRRVVEMVQAGAIGAIKNVHVFCAKSWGTTQPVVTADPVPPYLHYEMWVGPTPGHPYNKAYLPEKWRNYYAFGNGTLGDMGCHYLDLVFWALKLKYPTHVVADGPKAEGEDCPVKLGVHWDFPARGELPPVKVSWYDGGLKSDEYHDYGLDKLQWPTYSVLFIGEKGALVADYTRHVLLPKEKFTDYTPPKPSIPKSVGHHKEWVDACIANDPTAPLCRFDYSGPLSETVLLGALAHRVGKPIEWDAENLRATNAPEAEEIIKLKYRKGWSLEA
jgi:predicted dehydrogenase